MSHHIIDGCFNWRDNGVIPLTELRGREAVAFCGIAQPQSFRSSLEEAGVRIAHFFSRRDHHKYSDREITEIARAAAHESCLLVTTEKDAARLSPGHLDLLPRLCVLRLGIRITHGEDHVKKCLKRIGLS
jgi:tetraacyldisaccharide-1-P 4'-kinase